MKKGDKLVCICTINNLNDIDMPLFSEGIEYEILDIDGKNITLKKFHNFKRNASTEIR
jgi:hypothetical protein